MSIFCTFLPLLLDILSAFESTGHFNSQLHSYQGQKYLGDSIQMKHQGTSWLNGSCMIILTRNLNNTAQKIYMQTIFCFGTWSNLWEPLLWMRTRFSSCFVKVTLFQDWEMWAIWNMLCEEFSHDGVREGEQSPGEGEIPVLLFTTLELDGGKNPQIFNADNTCYYWKYKMVWM